MLFTIFFVLALVGYFLRSTVTFASKRDPFSVALYKTQYGIMGGIGSTMFLVGAIGMVYTVAKAWL